MDARTVYRLLQYMQTRPATHEEEEEEKDPAIKKQRQRRLARRKEEDIVEAKIIEIINKAQWESLKPNSGNAVGIGENDQICVGFQEDPKTGFRHWEWHGHILMRYEDSTHLVPEYFFGVYSQKMEKKEKQKKVAKEKEVEKDKKVAKEKEAEKDKKLAKEKEAEKDKEEKNEEKKGEEKEMGIECHHGIGLGGLVDDVFNKGSVLHRGAVMKPK